MNDPVEQTGYHPIRIQGSVKSPPQTATATPMPRFQEVLASLQATSVKTPAVTAGDAKRWAGTPELTAEAALKALALASGWELDKLQKIVDGTTLSDDPEVGALEQAIPLIHGQGLPSVSDILRKTLDRAVEKGFIPASERAAVEGAVIDLANRHGFNPDDFALVTLIESNGMNPKASNGHCHGVIQFCEGPNRGAATVGYAGQADRILELSVLEQLRLVDRYFQEVGVGKLENPGLTDLYLSVLMPAARKEQDQTSPLPIPGTQAKTLHESGDRGRPITRESIAEGLRRHGAALLTSARR